jgi:hypothetical protein
VDRPLERFDLDAANAAPGSGEVVDLSSASLTVVGNIIQMDFGDNGIGGNQNSNAGDGFYRVLVDQDSNGQFTEPNDGHLEFFRILGDADGDGRVDTVDIGTILRRFGTTGPRLNGDVNGDGVVNILDRLFAQRQFGKFLDQALLAEIDD